jgi:hypothetical protein
VCHAFRVSASDRGDENSGHSVTATRTGCEVGCVSWDGGVQSLVVLVLARISLCKQGSGAVAGRTSASIIITTPEPTATPRPASEVMDRRPMEM